MGELLTTVVYYLRKGGYVLAFVIVYLLSRFLKTWSTNYDESFGGVGCVNSNK